MVEEIPKVAEFECELGVYMGVLYKYPIEGHQITEEKMIIIYTNIYNEWIWRYTIFRPKMEMDNLDTNSRTVLCPWAGWSSLNQ